MDVQQVVRLAKGYVADVFQDEEPVNIGVEEIEFDDSDDAWNVTIGFSRPWNTSPRNALSPILGDGGGLRRSYKVVRIKDDDGRMIAIKQRPSLEG